MTSLEKVQRLMTEMLSARGRRSVAMRLVDRVGRRIPPELIHSHLLPEDVAGNVLLQPGATDLHDRPLRIGWVITPPIAGSGGHTTAFRMVKGLQDAGHRCELLLYDPFGGNAAEREAVIREYWPWITAPVRSISDGFEDLDACVATGWQTAHALVTRSASTPLHRLYFVQDYEPFFYAHGFEYALAEQTYRFGFANIALGQMVAGHLAQLGTNPAIVPFGCDTKTYHLTDPGPRSGIVFYSRAGTSRRGYLLATMALAELHRRRPDVPIKVYGPSTRADFPFPAAWQGLLKPSELNLLYNSSICGLGISFTNISLVVGEMLASGCAPVVNDSADARLDMPSPFVTWADPTPNAMADSLVRLVDQPPNDPAAVSSSMSTTWDDSSSAFVATVERLVWGRCRGQLI